ncbi:MAG: hypothetical protein WCK36_03950, partial [Candidatus Firestonebacteria bacterium]
AKERVSHGYSLNLKAQIVSASIMNKGTSVTPRKVPSGRPNICNLLEKSGIFNYYIIKKVCCKSKKKRGGFTRPPECAQTNF